MLGDHDWFLMVWAVICIVVVLGMSYWVTKFVAGRSGFGTRRGGKQIEILAQESIGRDQRLAVARVGEKYFVLGIAANNISLLTELDKDAAALWEAHPETPSNPGNPSFIEAFQDVLKQKMRR